MKQILVQFFNKEKEKKEGGKKEKKEREKKKKEHIFTIKTKQEGNNTPTKTSRRRL